MSTGIREIDTGTLPDRYARGWHCLGLVRDFTDGTPHSVRAFGTKFVVSPIRTAICTFWTAIAGIWAATYRRELSWAMRSPARSTTGGGAATAAANWFPTQSALRSWREPAPGTPTCAAACCSSGTTTRATHRRLRFAFPTSRSSRATSGRIGIGTRC